tara:strand:- start:148 stop:279 length:132 start_codon:yes stop_codon:yes gene_type:complete
MVRVTQEFLLLVETSKQVELPTVESTPPGITLLPLRELADETS